MSDTMTAPPTGDTPPPSPKGKGNVFTRMSKRLGLQGARLVLLAALIALSGMALGYAAGYPLRYVDYSSSSAVQLDQTGLAGNVDVAAALVAQEDLSAGWAPGDPALGGFGILGADVCGEVIETPTPLSGKETVVFTNPVDGTTVIAQALRVDLAKSARGYIDDVSDEVEKCENFFRTADGNRIKVESKALDRDPPITDHVTRVYQSSNGVQEWSMMSVGDVIIAIQYIGPTRPSENFLPELELAVLARVAPDDFAPAGTLDGEADVTGDEPAVDPAVDPATGETVPPDQSGGAADEGGGAADESGGP